jgi:hypothetical protein
MHSYARLIRETLALLQEESIILATPSDAQYFRTTSKKAPEPVKMIPKQVVQETPRSKKLPLPAQVPIIQEAPKKPIEAPVPSPIEAPIKNESFNLSYVKTIYQKLFPELPILPTIPSDERAKKIANRWKTKNQAAPISVLYFSEPEGQKELLKAITKAIDVYYGPARLIQADLIEKEKQWDTFLSCTELKLVIACDYTLWQLTDLMKYYQETPQRKLKDIPLFLLPDLSLYLKDPSLKRSLWKAIQRILCS